ncbi:hypothetical protein RND81_03G096800 [Saponaria officinalis]|uniref:KIB1-4 beta-propeller domain-containing protein n=1 Tax=Saponaria officinalis TaxID=3572 RepID=A0AAW1LZC8_SAPOF
MAPEWSLLPLDLLAIIALKSETFEDFYYFSAVCRSWNHAWSSIKHQWRATPVPWLLLAENTNDNPNHLRNIFNLGNNKCYQFNLPETFGTRCWGSPYGWLVMASRDFSIRLYNPITKAHICFPSLETFPNPPEYFDTGKQDYPHWCLTRFLSKLILLKVSQIGHDHEDGEFVIMALYNEKECLAFSRLGDQSWTSIYVDKIANMVVDVAVVGDRVFAMYEDGAVRYWNITEFQNLELGKPMDYTLSGLNILNNSERAISNLYLLQSINSNLLVVLRYKDDLFVSDDEYFIFQDKVYETDGFRVYQINPIDKSWDEIVDLREAALFVGNNSSMALSTVQAKCLQGNCIYFTDDENECWTAPKEFGGHDMGVYDIKCNKLWRFYD